LHVGVNLGGFVVGYFVIVTLSLLEVVFVVVDCNWVLKNPLSSL